MTPKHSNQLIKETSPYLLQHAHNPVNWYPWGEEALNKAKQDDKPILVSIGYSACHWCHVMERESFEDEATAKIMNEHFINIKIDREERPDLDHIYMDAVQAMTGSGGWPLNVFLTPEAKPFYGGTYFPPQRAFNRPSWQETLLGVKQAFSERRHEMDAQAENLTEHLLKSNAFGFQERSDKTFSKERTGEIFRNLMGSADRSWGGFGQAPKFPQTLSIQYLLRYGHLYQDQDAIDQALLSLDKMIEGGIYDQVGGGFSRYSTDTEWLVPHFEKMLYDNALLLSVTCDAWQLTGKKRYREVIGETMDFIEREMLHEQGGFYSALDADSEGVEGKFYVWEEGEVRDLLGKDTDIFCHFYDITAKGNWEEKNILRVKKNFEEFAKENSIDQKALIKILDKGRKKLLEERNKRVRPQLDDKIILGWNALMNTACSKAFAATGEERYRELAIGNMNFLLDNFTHGDSFYHVWKNGEAKYPAFLDDLAFLLQALLQLQEITADKKWLELSGNITEMVIGNFSEEGTGFFFYTAADQRDVIIRKKEVYDSAVPSGNSVMANNLWQLSILLDKKEWKQRSLDMTGSLSVAITRYPTSFGNWACQLLEIVTGTSEIVVLGPGYKDLLAEIGSFYIPQRVLLGSEKGDPGLVLLADKRLGEKAAIFLCRNYTCQAPVFSAKELISLINRGKNG